MGAQVHDVSLNKAKRALFHNRTSKAATNTRSSPTKCGHRRADLMAFPAQGCPRNEASWSEMPKLRRFATIATNQINACML